ncbi:MAG: D-lyxose/D-mannose family sugar isomerase [Victivallaceae bacterium]|nr:D-lyxose/D-mannose family sugar isomerase [Victivallaceae bacterium]
MKRSEINNYLIFAKEYFKKHCFELPPWAYWSPAYWAKAGAECSEIREKMLGWDLTDFGSGDFEQIGLLLFTIRNGSPDADAAKNYAEKIMIALPKQVTPIHFHWNKAEDIINRGGGRLVMKLWQATEDEELSETPVTVQVDGITKTFSAGEAISFSPGESITLLPRMYHTFWAEASSCIIGEVSRTNDDVNDNRFYEQIGRFTEIAEDELPLHLLCNEYPSAKKISGNKKA